MSNLNLNKVILGGRLTSDVELKQTSSGISVCSFTLAVNRKYQSDGQQQADFISCQAWRSTAEFISKYFKKGSSICITGTIQTRSWNDQNGNKRYATEVVASEVSFCESKNNSETNNTPTTQNASQSQNSGAYGYNPYSQAPSFEGVETDESLPF